MYNAEYAYIYNTGGYESVAIAGESISTHRIDDYEILRPISPEEVQKIDNAN